jgi:hypothetical protein
VSIVRLRAAKLIIRLAGAKRPVRKILQLTTPALIAEKDVKLPIRPESQYATVMIAALRLTRILLNCPELDDILIERQGRTVPSETVHSVSEQRSFAKD